MLVKPFNDLIAKHASCGMSPCTGMGFGLGMISECRNKIAFRFADPSHQRPAHELVEAEHRRRPRQACGERGEVRGVERGPAVEPGPLGNQVEGLGEMIAGLLLQSGRFGRHDSGPIGLDSSGNRDSLRKSVPNLLSYPRHPLDSVCQGLYSARPAR